MGRLLMLNMLLSRKTFLAYQFQASKSKFFYNKLFLKEEIPELNSRLQDYLQREFSYKLS